MLMLENEMGVTIKDIKKNNGEIIRVEVSEFQGREFINIRIWFANIDQNSGQIVFKPTQKGVALHISQFAELQDGINKLENYINDKNTGNIPKQFPEAMVQEEETEEKK
jgi:hypothetical protein